MDERIYHVWFGTKSRIAALQGDIEHDVKELFTEIARQTGVGLMELETSVDHVHLLVRVPPDRTLSSVMHQLKGASSRAILLKYPDIKMDTGKHAFWQKSYSYRRIDAADLPAVRSYVKSQDRRPLRHG